ncbi:MAG: GGDEF domain-containing protein [Rubrobacteraceae bacterium]
MEEHSQHNPPESLKRRVYLLSLAAGFPTVVLLWFTLGSDRPFVGFAYPILALYCGACAWMLWRNTISLQAIEQITFVMLTALVFSNLTYNLYAGDGLADVTTELTETTYTSLAILCLVSFLVFENNRALQVSLLALGASLLLVLIDSYSPGSGGLDVEEISWLFRMYAFLGSVVAFVYVIAYSKEQLVRQRTVAETMQRLAYTDHLTGLANRRQLYIDLETEVEVSRRYDRQLSMIFFDLDHFKQINDTYGHQFGDQTLQQVAHVVESRLRSSDRLGRWGGEEFVILSPDTNLEQATVLAERVREELETQPSHSSTPSPTASFGVVQYHDGEDIETFLKRADEALYHSKSQGRNRVECNP